jgi:hypothetical protein
MPDLTFEIVRVEEPSASIAPALSFKLRIVCANEHERIHSVMLRCQVRIVVTRRRYDPGAQALLQDIFGQTKRWGETLRDLLWTNTNTVVPTFSGSTETDLFIPCSYDFEVASTKYFHALADGDIPLIFLFSGTIFYVNEQGNLQIEQIPWSKEARFRLPVARWQEAIELYYPNSTWIRLNRDVFDRLYRYKIAHSLPTWEEVFVDLLRANDEREYP